jgi:hypothetical protein
MRIATAYTAYFFLLLGATVILTHALALLTSRERNPTTLREPSFWWYWASTLCSALAIVTVVEYCLFH